MEYALPF